MKDDRFKDAGAFEPKKAWGRITRANKDRAFEAKYPTRWWDRVIFTVGMPAAVILAVAGVVAILFGLWGILS